MRILRLSAAIAVVVCLILAASAPALALKDKPTKVREKPTKVVPQAPPGQAKKTPKPEHIPKPEQTPEPESVTQPSGEPVTKVEVCHKPGTPAEKTLWLPESAVPGHLGHGDVLGACGEEAPAEDGTPQGAEPTPWTTRLVTVGLSLFLILRGFVAALPL